jgi:hypothetical protein
MLFKSRNYKAQAAMEFLMTYGWALVLVLLATAALAYFGLLNPDRYITDKFTLGQGLFVKDGSVNDSHVTLMVYNGVGKPIRSLTVNVTNCMNNDRISAPVDMIDGQTAKIMINCTGATLGRKFKSNMVAIYYTDVLGQSVSHTVASGSLSASVKPSTSGLSEIGSSLSVQFVNPTDASGAISRSFILINVSAAHPNLTGIQIVISNASGTVATLTNPTSSYFVNYSSNLAASTYSFVATATAAGGLTASTETRIVTISPPDTTPPIFLNINPTPLPIDDNQSLSYDIEADDPSGIGCFTVNNTGMFSIDCNGILINITPTVAGIIPLLIRVNDTLGNTNQTTLTLNVSNTRLYAPNISFVYPTNATGVTLNQNFFLVNVSANSSGYSITSIVISIYNSSRDNILNFTSFTNNNYVNVSGLDAGLYYYNATATNSFNLINSTATRSVTLNLSRGAIMFVDPTPVNGTTQRNRNVTINVSVNQNVNSCNLNWTFPARLIGGEETRDSTHTINTFTSDGTLTVSGGDFNCEVLIVAGGGGGGWGNTNEAGGAGGAGGVLYASSYTVSSGIHNIVVGAGGAAPTSGTDGGNGSNSAFDSYVAIGGAGGAGICLNSINGGSGGGGCGGCSDHAGGLPTQTSSGVFTGYGNAGGNGAWYANFPGYGNAGGGGGAGGPGSSGHDRAAGTIGGGGPGMAFDISGSSVTYAAGGDGGPGRTSYAGSSALPNTGNGAVGGNVGGGAGGSGIVIIKCEEKNSTTAYPMTINNNGAATTASYTFTELEDSDYAYFVSCNFSSNNRVNSSETRQLNISNPPPSIDITLMSPNSATDVKLLDSFDITFNVSCSVADCGDINLGLDPVSGTEVEVISVSTTDESGCYSNGVSSMYDGNTGTSFALRRCPGGQEIEFGFEPTRLLGIRAYPTNRQGCMGYRGLNGWTVATWDGSSWTDQPELSVSGQSSASWTEKELSSPVGGVSKIKFYNLQTNGCGRGAKGFSEVEIYASPEKGLVSPMIGATPFYTTDSNPIIISLSENQSRLVTWHVVATGEDFRSPTYEFFAYANLTSNNDISAESERVNMTILYPDISIDWFTPTHNFNAEMGDTVTFTANVSCFNGNCGTVNVALDPPAKRGDTGTTMLCDRSNWLDLDNEVEVSYGSMDGDLSKGDNMMGGCCNFAVDSGAEQVDTGSSDFASVTCGPNDGRAYSASNVRPYSATSSVWCLKTPNKVYIKYYSLESCCACINVVWEITNAGGKSGLVPMWTAGDTPFYTNNQNPTTITLNEGQSQLVSWDVVVANGDPTSATSTFFAFANLTSEERIQDRTDDVNLTISFPSITIDWVTPTADTTVIKNEPFTVSALVSCQNIVDCEDIIVSLGPVEGSEVRIDSAIATDESGCYSNGLSTMYDDNTGTKFSLRRCPGGQEIEFSFDPTSIFGVKAYPASRQGCMGYRGLHSWTVATWDGSSWTDQPELSVSGLSSAVWTQNELSSPISGISKLKFYNFQTYGCGRGAKGFSEIDIFASPIYKELVSPSLGDTPFYTTDSNPVVIHLNKGQSAQVNWTVYPSGQNTIYNLYAFANVSLLPVISAMTNNIVINISNPIDITILSPTSGTAYMTSVSPIYFNLSLSNPASSCEFTLDNWATTNSMTLDGTAMFASASKSTGWTDGTYTAKFRCTTPAGKVNDWMSVTFDAVTSGTYKRPITLYVSSGATSTGYQVPLSLNIGNMGSNFDWNCQQIRFVSVVDGSILPYYTEACDPMTQTATIWLKSDQPITTSGYTIYAHYGNPSWSSMSNRNNVFEAYSQYPDYTGWSGASSTSVCSPGGQSMMGGFGVYGNAVSTQKGLGNLPASDYEVTFDYYFIDSWDGESGLAYWNSDNIWSLQHFCCSPPYSSGTTNLCGQSYEQWFESTEFALNPRTVIVSHPGGSATLRFTSSLDQDPGDESWGVDNIKVRKYHSPAPTYSIGSEIPG